jgi:hypothetical protein
MNRHIVRQLYKVGKMRMKAITKTNKAPMRDLKLIRLSIHIHMYIRRVDKIVIQSNPIQNVRLKWISIVAYHKQSNEWIREKITFFIQCLWLCALCKKGTISSVWRTSLHSACVCLIHTDLDISFSLRLKGWIYFAFLPLTFFITHPVSLNGFINE